MKVGEAMGFFRGMFKLFDAVYDAFGSHNNMNDLDNMVELAELEALKIKYSAKVAETMPYAIKADESYRLLIYENLRRVPAVELYDGEYVDRLDRVLNKIMSATKLRALEKADSKLTRVATEIQTYLNEETSDLEAAKLWDSKFVKGVQDHIPPHFKGVREYEDVTMSEVMRAFRNWSSFAQSVIDMYGSQRLINATYEAVEEGKDAMDYMTEILDLNQRDSGFGGGLHERVIVPNAGFFGGGFFF